MFGVSAALSWIRVFPGVVVPEAGAHEGRVAGSTSLLVELGQNSRPRVPTPLDGDATTFGCLTTPFSKYPAPGGNTIRHHLGPSDSTVILRGEVSVGRANQPGSSPAIRERRAER